MSNNYQRKFLSDNPDFPLIKNEIWQDPLTRMYYKPFPRFINFEERSIFEFLFIYKEKAKERSVENEYESSFWMRIKNRAARLWIRITNAIVRFSNQNVGFQYRVLTRIILAISAIMVLSEFLSFKYGNLHSNLFVAALCLCLVYVPIQMLINLFNSIHIYCFIVDNSPDNLTHNSCICFSHEIRRLNKYKLLHKYIMQSFKESEVKVNQLFVKQLVQSLRESTLLPPKALTWNGCIYKYNNGEYCLLHT